MRNAGGHQCKEKVSGSEKKSSRECVRHFLHKKVSGSFQLYSCNTTTKKCTKKCAACARKVVSLLIRPIVLFHRCPALPSPLSTRFYILFEQTTNIIDSFDFSPG